MPLDKDLAESWLAFCDALKALPEQTLLHPEAPDTPLDHAEGYRYLTRLARIAFDEFMEDADGRFPRFYEFNTPHKKILLDNPDTIYLRSPLSPDCEYRVWGRRGTIAYVDFAVYSGYYGSSGPTGTDAHLNHRELQTNPDGTFEIWLSPKQKPDNWLRMGPHASRFEVRESFLDRETEQPVRVQIERVGDDGLAPPPLAPERIAQALRDTKDHMLGIARLIFEMGHDWHRQPNHFVVFDPAWASDLQSNADSHYLNGFWSLKQDEALVVDFVPTRADYWSLHFTNRWMETHDYRYHRSGLNAHLALPEPDGSVRIVLAHRNPGIANFVTTDGHTSGYMTFRWILAEGKPVPETRVVPVASLGSSR